MTDDIPVRTRVRFANGRVLYIERCCDHPRFALGPPYPAAHGALSQMMSCQECGAQPFQVEVREAPTDPRLPVAVQREQNRRQARDG